MFYKTFLKRAFFLLAPAANHGQCKPFFIGWIKRQHAAFGVDLEKGLDLNSLSNLADGTPYFSSDLLYFTLLLTFYLDKTILSPTPFLLFVFSDKIFPSPIPLLSLLFGKKCSKSNFNSTKIFKDESKFRLSRKIIPILQKSSKTIPNSVLVA